MRFPLRSWSAAIAVAAFLVTGCRSGTTRPSSVSAAASGKDAQRVIGQSLVLPGPVDDAVARAHAHYAAAVVHELRGEPSDALEEYSKSALTNPTDEDLVLEVSRKLLQARKLEQALEVISKAADSPLASGTVLARQGLIYSQLGKTTEAEEANRRAIERSPALLTGYQNLFVSKLQARQEQDAMEVLEQAARQTNASPEFYLALAELFWNLGVQAVPLREQAVSKARAVLETAERLGPTNVVMRFALAEQWQHVGESEKAAKIYHELLDRLPEGPGLRDRIHARLSEIYLRSQDHKRAMEQLEALVEADPTNPLPHYFLGGIAMENREPEKAVEHLSKTVLLKPDFEQAYYDLANAQISADKTSLALATLDEARKKFPENFASQFLRAVAFTRQKSYSEAIRQYTAAELSARASDPKRLNHFFYFQFGAACERSGDIEQAERHFLKAIEMQPEFPEALNYLGYMWAERGTNLHRAREFIERALKAEPKNAAYLDSLGWVLYKLGEPKQALEHLRKAIEFSEEPDATLHDHLGDIHAALGEREKAIQAWKKSLSIEDNEEVKKKLSPPEP